MGSFSCIIKVSESFIIQMDNGPVQEKTHKNHLVTKRIRSKHLLKNIVQKQSISQQPFAQSQVPSKVTTRNTLNLKNPRKLNICTSCTDNATPCMANNKKNCEITGHVLIKCHQSKYWASNKFCQLSCFKANNGYKMDDCCKNKNHIPCYICTNKETLLMETKNNQCSSSNLLLKNSNSDLPEARDFSASRIVLRKEMVVIIIIVVSLKYKKMKHKQNI